MTFSVLSKDHVDQIVSLFENNFSDGWNKNMLSSAFDGGRFLCIGAFCDKALVGVITCSISIDDADIEGIAVDKSFRRRGVGAQLLKTAEQAIKEKNINAVLLEVRQGNLPAKTLYEKAGYEQISVRKGYYADGENAIVMKKEFR